MFVASFGQIFSQILLTKWDDERWVCSVRNTFSLFKRMAMTWLFFILPRDRTRLSSMHFDRMRWQVCKHMQALEGIHRSTSQMLCKIMLLKLLSYENMKLPQAIKQHFAVVWEHFVLYCSGMQWHKNRTRSNVVKINQTHMLLWHETSPMVFAVISEKTLVGDDHRWRAIFGCPACSALAASISFSHKCRLSTPDGMTFNNPVFWVFWRLSIHLTT